MCLPWLSDQYKSKKGRRFKTEWEIWKNSMKKRSKKHLYAEKEKKKGGGERNRQNTHITLPNAWWHMSTLDWTHLFVICLFFQKVANFCHRLNSPLELMHLSTNEFQWMAKSIHSPLSVLHFLTVDNSVCVCVCVRACACAYAHILNANNKISLYLLISHKLVTTWRHWHKGSQGVSRVINSK